MTGSPWISAHLFYHQDPRPLLTHCVRPLITELRAAQSIERYFFVRYWQGGPHIRLRILPTRQASREALQRMLEQRADSFFANHPAIRPVQDEVYAQRAALFSEFEYGVSEKSPLYPNNSLHYIPYIPETTRYGGVAALPTVEQHFMESSEISLELLQQDRTRNQWTGQALSMMLVGMLQYTNALPIVTSMFESYFFWAHRVFGPQRASSLEQFEQRYLKQEQQLQRLITRLLETRVAELSVANDFLADWSCSIRMLTQALRSLARQGDLPDDFWAQAPAPRTSLRFGSLPGVILSCLHMHNNRLGVSLFEEAYLTFLVFRTLKRLQ